MEENKHTLWLNTIAEFIGEYSKLNPGYSPQELALNLEEKFSIRLDNAEKLALLIDKEVNNKILLASIELNLTFNCNLACEYCFVHTKSPKDIMSFNTAQKAIDFIFDNSYENINITLLGGEPLLEFELIKKIVPYAEEKAKKYSKNLNWAITTNGTLIDEKILAFFAKYQINLLLSIDGGKESHDRYRKTKSGEGTWLKIISLLPLIRQYQSWIGARMTVSPENIEFMFEDFKQLVSLGINQFIIAPAQGERYWSKEQINQYGCNLIKTQQEYYDLKKAGIAIRIDDFENDEIECKGWGCRAGITSLAVAPNGDISPCSKLLGLTDESGKCIVGNIHRGINYKLLVPFRKPESWQTPQCKQCTNKCTGGCYAVNYEQTGNHFTPSDENCLFWLVKKEIARISKDNKSTNVC